MTQAITSERLEAWLQILGRAWETADAELATSLFDAGVVYRDNPFEPPIVGAEAVRQYWLENLATQREVRFEGRVLAVEGEVGVVNWQVSFIRVPSGEAVKLDGVSMGRFREGKPSEWLEWWHKLER